MNPFEGKKSGLGGFRIGPGMISPFIKAMLVANVAMFLLQAVYPQVTRVLGLIPAEFFGDFPNKIYQPFTYMFLHGGFWHLFFNMFVLWMFGTEIELTWRSRTFGRFYLLAGLAGAVLTLIVSSSQMVPVVGASAAIYGVLIAYWLMFPERKLYIYFLFPVKVKWAIPAIMLLGFLAGGGNIAHMAHLGGAVFAFVYLKTDWRPRLISGFFRNFRRRRQESKQQKNRQKAENIMKRVDDVLDKINEVGIENISAAERKLLEEASLHLSEENSAEDR
ncbi:MAG: rhomboid family intramembrane serine protease [candidate division Zixibacteria bacterium]|nr:rhomboid family intramembrane serine protease [candidate division Zixibacteria bacterium]